MDFMLQTFRFGSAQVAQAPSNRGIYSKVRTTTVWIPLFWLLPCLVIWPLPSLSHISKRGLAWSSSRLQANELCTWNKMFNHYIVISIYQLPSTTRKTAFMSRSASIFLADRPDKPWETDPARVCQVTWSSNRRVRSSRPFPQCTELIGSWARLQTLCSRRPQCEDPKTWFESQVNLVRNVSEQYPNRSIQKLQTDIPPIPPFRPVWPTVILCKSQSLR